MDDQRFDSLTKACAGASSRRTLFKVLLGLGATVGLPGATNAARRPTPTPKPITCPGQQTAQGGQCVCISPPAPGPAKCGSDCCNPAGVGASHSECCDNACCYGHCYGEELCCDYPLVFCEAQNQCCFADDNQCCGSQGCCDHACCPTTNGDQCCEGATPRCCGGDACIPESGCCSDSECSGCQSCIDHICQDDQSKCGGCLDCSNGACVKSDLNCDDGDPCTRSTCNDDGSCTPTTRDCRIQGCGCVGSGPCHVATCNQDTGACSEEYACDAPGCCLPSDMCFQAVCNGNSCQETLYCQNDELTTDEANSCCANYGNPDPACLFVSGEACTTVCPSGLGFVQTDRGCCFLVYCECCTDYDEAGIVDFGDCLGSCQWRDE